MFDGLRATIANYIAARREDPIQFTPHFGSQFFGAGLGSTQPGHDLLLHENLGVAAMATRAIANRMSTLNPQVKITRRQSEGTFKDEILDDHPLKLLLDRPHPNYTMDQLLYLGTHHIVSTGEAYLLKVRNSLRVPTMLQPMPPGKVSPQINGGLITGYVVLDGGGNQIPLAIDEVIRIWFPDPEAMFASEGYIGPNAAIVDAQKFSDQHLRAHYQSDATPPTILKATADAEQPDQPQKDRFAEQWVKKYSTRKGQNRAAPIFLPTGWDVIFAAMQSGADITPLLEHWQSNQLMNLGTPASILGRVVSGDRSSAETNQFVFDLHTVLPVATLYAQALTLQLAPDFDPNIFVEFEQFVSADKAFELAKEGQDLDKKVKTVQQVLIDRNEDPDLAPWGGLPVGTLADTPYTGEERDFAGFGFGGGESVDELEEPTDDDAKADTEPERAPTVAMMRAAGEANWTKALSMQRVLNREKRFVPVFSRALRKVLRQQQKAVNAELRKTPRARNEPINTEALFDVDAWDEIFAKATADIRTRAFLEAGQESMDLLSAVGGFVLTKAVIDEIIRQEQLMIKLVNTTTARRLRKSLDAIIEEGGDPTETLSKMGKAVDEVFAKRKKNSATIARTEMHRASQTGQMAAFAQANVPFKQWLDSRDSNVRETHFQEGILPVPLEADFVLPSGHRAAQPGDSRLPPEESINCRCDAGPVFGTGNEVPVA